MKNIILILSALTIFLSANAQQAQKVLPFSREQHSMDWYKQQAIAWQKKVDKNSRDAEAWYNLYYAKRLLLYHNMDDARPYEEKQREIEQLLKKMRSAIPNSYEYNVIKWQAGGLNFENLEYLLKADKLGEGRTEHLDHMINIAEIQGDVDKRHKYALRKFNAGEVSAGMLYYNYNVLAGLDSNAILIVIGDNDTYPAWVLQAQGFRRDVHVLNLSLLLMDDYRKNIFDQLGVENIAVDWGKGSESVETNFRKKVARYLIANKKQYPVYIALTASYITGIAEPAIEDKLYLEGLAYKYCDNPIDNIAVLKRNFEKRYALDYLDKVFYPDISADLVRVINTNYIVPMVKLYDHYSSSGDISRQQWIKKEILSVSKDTQYEEEVKKYLSGK